VGPLGPALTRLPLSRNPAIDRRWAAGGKRRGARGKRVWLGAGVARARSAWRWRPGAGRAGGGRRGCAGGRGPGAVLASLDRWSLAALLIVLPPPGTCRT
ncbi:unnamed protein product, partial [Urochloa humidicola]